MHCQSNTKKELKNIKDINKESTIELISQKYRSLMLQEVLKAFNTALVSDLSGAQAIVDNLEDKMDGSISD